MDLKFIFIVSLIVMLFAALLLNGWVFYNWYDSTNTGKITYAAQKWYVYSGFGLHLGAIALAVLLFIKR